MHSIHFLLCHAWLCVVVDVMRVLVCVTNLMAQLIINHVTNLVRRYWDRIYGSFKSPLEVRVFNRGI